MQLQSPMLQYGKTIFRPTIINVHKIFKNKEQDETLFSSLNKVQLQLTIACQNLLNLYKTAEGWERKICRLGNRKKCLCVNN